jgi:N-acetylglucosaminyl-diphospho-decaprenol L-rhamnosyltransferase
MTPDEDVSISVIMVTYNSALVVLASLLPLIAHKDIEIIVVDNNSQDDTLALLEHSAPDARILRNLENVGFAKAVNRGVQQARGDVIVLLNPDAVVTPVHLRLLCGRLQDKQIGVIAPVIRHPAGRLKILSAGRLPSAWRMFTHYSGLSRIFKGISILEGHYLLPSKKLRGLVNVEWVTGACLAVRRTVWDQLGGLSERWFMYAEDIEFCHRVGSAGLRICLDMQVSATHLVGASDGARGDAVNPAWVLNLYDFYRSNMSSNSFTAGVWRVAVSAGLMSRSFLYRTLALKPGNQENAAAWRAESRRFAAFSNALITARGRRSPARRNKRRKRQP